MSLGRERRNTRLQRETTTDVTFPEAIGPLEVVHDAVPGRLRLKLPGLRHNAALARRLENVLVEWGGFARAQASPVTATLLVVTDRLAPKDAMCERVTNAWAIACGKVELDQPDWSRLSAQEAALRLNVSLDGLTDAEAATRLSHFGPNGLPGTEPQSVLRLLLRQFRSLPSLLLMASACASLVTGGVLDAVLIGSVVAANAAIGTVTESRANRIIEGFVSHTSGTALLRRGGKAREIAADTIVPGDVLVLMPGTLVAADARIFESHDLVTDESMLTGESLPVNKTADVLLDPGLPLAERRNLVFGGTLVLAGNGLALVVSTGSRTEIGRISAAAAEATRPRTPLQRRLAGLELGLTGMSFAAAAAVLGLGLLNGQAMLEILPTAIALAVAAIPEGLPTAATVILARGLREMQRQGVLIRRLDAVETLGSVNAICFDKTGTLTQNRMAASVIALNGESLLVRDGRIYRDGSAIDPSSSPPLMLLMRVAVLCNESEVDTAGEHRFLNGSSTENALLLAAMQAGLAIEQVRSSFPLLDVQGRTEQRRYMITRHRTAGGVFIAVKGSPEDVLQRCRYCADGSGHIQLTMEHRTAIRTRNHELAGRGLRVLGFACSFGEAAEQGDLIWLGMVGLSDPPRAEMRAIIADFHKAGIRTIMVTGDQAATARSVAEELGLAVQPQVINGIAALTQAELNEAAGSSDVFARITPVDKLRIVQALQSRGQVVAMTGDGSNDGPALRAADIGVALGGGGTDIARETADVVLAGDDLATMVVAVRQGRAIYANLRKSVHFLVGTNSGEVMLALVAAALGVSQPLNPAQLLWINLLTDVAIAVALGFEPPEADLMTYPPRDPAEELIRPDDAKRLVMKGALFGSTAFAAHLYGLARHGPGGGGIGFVTLLGAQLLDGLSSRSQIQPWWRLPPNPALRNSLLGMAGLQTVATLFPATRRILRIGILGWADLAVIAGGSLVPFLTTELTKLPELVTGGAG